MDQSAEAIAAYDLDIVLDRAGKGSQRGGLAQGADVAGGRHDLEVLAAVG